MKSWLRVRGVILVGLVLFAVALSVTADPNTIQYTLGQTLLFNTAEQPTNRCCCQPNLEIQVLGRRITDASNKVVHSAVYAAPIPASTWQERWPEIRIHAVDKAATQVDAAPPGAVLSGVAGSRFMRIG